jgi:hypothetical protein
VGILIYRWKGATWTALLSLEPYGLHFSVGGQLTRDPTDEEVKAAKLAYRSGQWETQRLVEVTAAHRKLGAINPHVRHFVPQGQAARIFERAAAATE